MQFWSVSPQNGLKMCAFLRSITWATGSNQSVCIVWKACNRNHRSSPNQSGPVQFSVGPMDQTFKHYLRCVVGDMESRQVVEEAEEDGGTVMLMVMSMCCCCQAYKWHHFLPVFGCANVTTGKWSVRRPRVYKPLLFITLSSLLLFLKSHLYFSIVQYSS